MGHLLSPSSSLMIFETNETVTQRAIFQTLWRVDHEKNYCSIYFTTLRKLKLENEEYNYLTKKYAQGVR